MANDTYLTIIDNILRESVCLLWKDIVHNIQYTIQHPGHAQYKYIPIPPVFKENPPVYNRELNCWLNSY